MASAPASHIVTQLWEYDESQEDPYHPGASSYLIEVVAVTNLQSPRATSPVTPVPSLVGEHITL